jgi:hypothetical protein
MSLPKWATPAKWMKDAVATDRGWVNEKTGEMYKMHRDLKNKIAALAPKKAKPAPAPAPEPAAPAPAKKTSKKKED